MYNLLQDENCHQEDYRYRPEVAIDARVSSLIDALYNSSRLNKNAIAEALTWICYEINPEYEENFTEAHITLVYHDDFPKTFSNWLDCIDDATGYLNYHKLLMGCTQQKQIVEFIDIFSATDALVYQLTSFRPFDESVLSGALLYLAKCYGVKHDEVLYTNSTVKRK